MVRGQRVVSSTNRNTFQPFTGDTIMSRFKKTLISLFIVIVIAATASAGVVYYLLRSSLPDHSAAFTREMDEPVTVVRDERGVAHIRADTFPGLFFSQGYVHADERLWQMEFNRRVVQGRLSEILGEELVGTDRFLRKLGLSRVAQRVIDKTSAEGQAVMRHYARGVNARIAEGRLPPEMRILGIRPKPWEPVDIAGVLALMSYDLGTNWQEESIRMALAEVLDPKLFQEIMPPYDDWETPAIWRRDQAHPGEEVHHSPMELFDHTALAQIEAFLPKLGSNSWVVSPDRWAGETALLANDPHLTLGLPSIWFENSLAMNGTIRVNGWSIPGTPGVVIGHNEKIAWGMTNIGDTQDLFLERRHPEDPHRFLFDDKWYAAKVIKEEIQVKGREQPEIIKVVITRNGPLISENPAMSLKWTANHIEASTVDAIIGMNKAENGDQFRSALAHFTAPVQNIVYADTDGNIGFQTAGLLPIRKKGKGLMPSPGWDAEYGWEGFIPADELPALYNPPQGYIITANHKVTGDDYPYIIAIDDASPYRMMRIEEVLGSSDSLTLRDMMNLQTDWYNKHAAERLPLWLDLVTEHAERFPGRYDDVQRRGLSLLSEWVDSPVSEPKQAAPAIYAVWYLNVMEDVFRDAMGNSLYHRFIDKGYMAFKALDYLLEQQESQWFEDDLGHMLAESYWRTINDIIHMLGPDPETWQWQNLQSVSIDHILGQNRWLRPWFSRGPYPYGGDYEAVGRAAYRLNNPFNVHSAAGLRFIAVMNPEIEVHAVIAGGQSGHFMADHYDDQIQTWLDRGYFRIETPVK